MEDLVKVLTKFHRDVVVPDIERIVGASEQRVRDEMQRRSELLELKGRVDGLQEQVRALEPRLDE